MKATSVQAGHAEDVGYTVEASPEAGVLMPNVNMDMDYIKLIYIPLVIRMFGIDQPPRPKYRDNASSVSAKSGCRCGDSAFLGIARVNIPAPEHLKPCVPHKLVDARGSGEPQGVSLMFQIAIERILANNTETVSQSVIYPAGFDQNVTSGVQNMVDTIKFGLEDCPDQKFSLFGYSQGATVVLEALSKLDQVSTAAVNSVVLVGNPYRIPGRASNVNSQGNSDNRTTFGLFATRALKSNQSIPTYTEAMDRSGMISDICLENDIVCAVDPECTCQLASDHMSYGLMQSIQDLIFDHVISHI